VVAGSGQSTIPARKLAERLRALREREYEPLTQDQLAIALGGEDRLSSTVISHWEKPSADRLPPPHRLAAYARLFCSGRSFVRGGPRMLRDEELTDQERQREAELYAELVELRHRVQPADEALRIGEPASIWDFSDVEVVSIVCPEASDPPSYARRDHLNYTRSARFADLDALLVVLEQVKAANPKSKMRIRLPQEMESEFVRTHLIFIGGAAVEAATKIGSDASKAKPIVNEKSLFAPDIPLPIARPIPSTETHAGTYLYHCQVGDEKREFESVRDPSGVITQDIGLIGRCPNPFASERTVTVLSGITSRGVHGAALCLTDPDVRDRNEGYLRDALGSTDRFCVLVKVPVLNDEAMPPELWRDTTVLYKWSDKTGARW
jgi:Helix-turn-helix domain